MRLLVPTLSAPRSVNLQFTKVHFRQLGFPGCSAGVVVVWWWWWWRGGGVIAVEDSPAVGWFAVRLIRF